MRTFQRIPRAIDTLLDERGGKRLLERGVGDAQAAEFFEIFDNWEADLWKTLAVVSDDTISCNARLTNRHWVGIRH